MVVRRFQIMSDSTDVNVSSTALATEEIHDSSIIFPSCGCDQDECVTTTSQETKISCICEWSDDQRVAWMGALTIISTAISNHDVGVQLTWTMSDENGDEVIGTLPSWGELTDDECESVCLSLHNYFMKTRCVTLSFGRLDAGTIIRFKYPTDY